MGKFTFADRPAQGPTSPVSCMGCIENKGLVLAPQVGLEPTTLRLTAVSSDSLKFAVNCYMSVRSDTCQRFIKKRFNTNCAQVSQIFME
jgi:hypothetical protein